jgi:iron complex outermembrane receptor protein
MILAPTKNIDVLVDWYHIRKEHESALLGAQFIIDHPELYAARVIRDTNVANQLTDAAGKPIAGTGPISQVNRAYVNQGATDTSGIDFEVTMRSALGENGKITSKLSWSYLLTYKRSELPGDAETNVAGSNGGISDFATSGPDMPRNRANASLNWSIGDHSLTGTVNFVSSVSLLRRTNNAVTYPVPFCQYGTGQPAGSLSLGGLPKFNYYEDVTKCEVNSWTTLGVNYAYTGIKNLTLGLNIQNLLNTKAPYDPRYPTTGFNTQLHNGEGRYFRGSASYKF